MDKDESSNKIPSDLTKMKKLYDIEDHTDEVFYLVKLPDRRLASCSRDGTIKIFNPEDDYHCDVTMKHEGLVVSFDFIGNDRIVSHNASGHIYFWTYGQYTCQLENIDDVELSVRKIKILTKNRLAICKEGYDVEIWTGVHPIKLIQTLADKEQFPLNVFQPKEKEILLAVYAGGIVIIWDLNTYQKISSHECQQASNGILQYDQNTVYILSSYEMVILNLIDYQFSEVPGIEDGLFHESMVKLRDGNILFRRCSWLMIFNPKTKKVEQKFHSYEGGTAICAINDHQIAMNGDEKNKIIIYEY